MALASRLQASRASRFWHSASPDARAQIEAQAALLGPIRDSSSVAVTFET